MFDICNNFERTRIAYLSKTIISCTCNYIFERTQQRTFIQWMLKNKTYAFTLHLVLHKSLRHFSCPTCREVPTKGRNSVIIRILEDSNADVLESKWFHGPHIVSISNPLIFISIIHIQKWMKILTCTNLQFTRYNIF